MVRIKEILKEKGITQQEFADMLLISRSALVQQMNGKPSLTTIERMAEALNIPIWQFFISPSEITLNCTSKEELTALIQHKGDFYRAGSVEELEKIVEKIKGNGVIPDHKNSRGKEYYQ